MDIAEIDAIRTKHSKQWKDGPCPPWYAMKTVLRQAAKLIPNPRLQAALQVMDVDERVEAAEEIPASIDGRLPAGLLASGDDGDTPVHGRPGQQFTTDPLREESDGAPVREYQLREPTPGPDEYDEAPTAKADDLEARRAGVRVQIGDASKPLPKSERETIALVASREPDLGALDIILKNTREKAARAQRSA